MTKKNLVLTSLKQNFSNNKENVLLGNWCNDYSSYNIEKKLITSNHWSSQQKRIQDAEKIKALYEKIFSFFFKTLNSIHNKKNSERYWRVLLGPFLYEAIPIIYDRWETVRYYFDSQNIDKISVRTFESYKLKSKDYSIDSIKALWFDDEVNQIIFNKILKENYSHLISFSFFDLNKKQNNLSNSKGRKKSFYEFFMSILFGLNFYKLILKMNKYIFDSRIISKNKFFELNIKLRNIPLHYFFFFSILESKLRKIKKNPDKINMRQSLKNGINDFTKDRFEVFLVNILIDLLPEMYLEKYDQSLSKISKYFESKKKIIFSQYHIYYNDVFKLWTAEMLNKGSVLIISEHGGFLPLFEHEFFNHENKIADYHFISNDFKLASNNIKLPTVINIYKKTVFNFSKQKNLTFIHRECGLYNHRLCSNMPVPHIFREFDYLINSIKYLKKEIKDNIKYKCINNTKAYFKENFSNKYGKEKIINPKEKYEITVKNSKILVHLYISTPFYESLHFNVPSLVLIPKTHWIFDKNFKKYIDDLEKKKILFYDPQKMSEHINNIWHNVDEWWLNQEIQLLIKKFLNSINFKDDDPVSRYFENLKKLPLNINVKN